MFARPSLFLVLIASVLGAAQGGFHVIKSIPVPGEGGWDYLTVDEGARRLYVSHGTQVEVLDVDSGAITGKIPGTPGVHGIAVVPDLGRGFTSNGQSSSVTIFDLKTLKPLTTVPVGKKPDAIMYDPATKRVFAFNGDSDSATAIDAATGKVAGTVELGGGPEFAVSDEKGHIFNNLEEKNTVLKIDSKALKVDQKWPLAPCEAPSSIAMDRKTSRLFIGCGNHMMAVVNADNGKVVATVPIGDHVDATAFDASENLIFNSCGDGTLAVIHEDTPDKYTAVETVKTAVGAKTLALDPKTHQIFLSTARYAPMPPMPGQSSPKKGIVLPGSFTVLVVGR